MTDHYFTAPTEQELRIIGELRKIEIDFTSFSVYTQPLPSIEMHRWTYPLQYLKRFFRLNGEAGNPGKLVVRPAELFDEMLDA